VGYDIHLLRFVDGEPKARVANRVHELLSRAAEAEPDQHGYARVSWEGGEADVYGVTRSANESTDSILFSRPAGSERIFDLIYAIARAGEMAVLLPDGAVCLVEPDHAEHLPAELKGRPRYAIDSGTALADVIRRL
jgi:hypothetical protein